MLNADPTDWLLEKDNPPIRYFTLVDVLGRSAEDAEIEQAKEDIMRTGAVPQILARQKGGGYWGKPEDFYIRSKIR